MKIYKSIRYIVILFIAVIILSKVQSTPDRFDYSEIKANTNIQIYLPYYIPDSFKLQEYSIDDSFVFLVFNSDSKKLHYTQMPAKNFTLSLDNENHTISEFSSDKFTGYLSESKNFPNFYKLTFYDDDNFYEISGIIGKNDILKMADSIEKYVP